MRNTLEKNGEQVIKNAVENDSQTGEKKWANPFSLFLTEHT